MIFLGCVGKSGQMPLHVWLPDAMAGPTPVSALIHAATMVTAGVFLVARLYPVFAQSLVVMNTIAIVGVITLFFAGFVALVQDDIKKVLAYSTVSQLGYMMAALGVGGYTAGHLPPVHPRVLQGPAVPRLRLADPRRAQQQHVRHGRHAEVHAVDVLDLHHRLARAGRVPADRRVLLQGRDPGLGPDLGRARATSTGNFVFWLGLAGAAITTFYMARACFLIFFGEHRGVHHPEVATHDEHAEQSRRDRARRRGRGGRGRARPTTSATRTCTTTPRTSPAGRSSCRWWCSPCCRFPVGFAGGFLWDDVGGAPERNFETWTATHAIEEATIRSSRPRRARAARARRPLPPEGEGRALAAGDDTVLAASTLAAECRGRARRRRHPARRPRVPPRRVRPGADRLPRRRRRGLGDLRQGQARRDPMLHMGAATTAAGEQVLLRRHRATATSSSPSATSCRPRRRGPATS